MKGVISIGGLTANKLFNRTLDQFFSFFIALVLLPAISILIMIGPRIYYAISKSGHFFKIAKRVTRTRIPRDRYNHAEWTRA
jgi:APA family basic amino acid/polyamine antiporter